MVAPLRVGREVGREVEREVGSQEEKCGICVVSAVRLLLCSLTIFSPPVASCLLPPLSLLFHYQYGVTVEGRGVCVCVWREGGGRGEGLETDS